MTIDVFVERNKLVVGSRVDGERERLGVVDVAVSSVEAKGDLAVAVKLEVEDDVRLVGVINVSCGCKVTVDVIGSDTDPEMSTYGEETSCSAYAVTDPDEGLRDAGLSKTTFYCNQSIRVG